MNLILWRHAEAEEGAKDLERKLTSHGHKQAKLSAKWLNKHAPSDMRVLVSPARRAIQTADALDRKYEIVPSIAPGASVEAILEAADWPKAGGTVLLVGHQPTLGAVLRQLLAGEAGAWTVHKSGIWWLGRRERNEETQVVVRAVVNPNYL